jgi:hypothetical protein
VATLLLALFFSVLPVQTVWRYSKIRNGSIFISMNSYMSLLVNKKM